MLKLYISITAIEIYNYLEQTFPQYLQVWYSVRLANDLLAIEASFVLAIEPSGGLTLVLLAIEASGMAASSSSSSTSSDIASSSMTSVEYVSNIIGQLNLPLICLVFSGSDSIQLRSGSRIVPLPV